MDKLKDDAVLAAELASMKYKWYHDRVFLSVDPAEKAVLGSGIIVAPDNMEEKKYAATVVALGGGPKVAEAGVKVCDRVVIQRWNPTECAVRRADGREVLLIAIHVNDLYIGWEDEELQVLYEDTLCRLTSST